MVDRQSMNSFFTISNVLQAKKGVKMSARKCFWKITSLEEKECHT